MPGFIFLDAAAPKRAALVGGTRVMGATTRSQTGGLSPHPSYDCGMALGRWGGKGALIDGQCPSYWLKVGKNWGMYRYLAGVLLMTLF